MAVCCLVPVILVIGFLSLYKGNSSYWTWLIILLCPLLHILMMKGHNHHHSHDASKDTAQEKPEQTVSSSKRHDHKH